MATLNNFKSSRKGKGPLRPPTSDTNSQQRGKRSHSADLDKLLLKLRPFQREAYDFATQGIVSPRSSSSSSPKDPHLDQQQSFQYDPSLLGKGRILLADEMGLGKSITSLAIMAHYRDEWPLLILCPASLKNMWPEEIEKFLPSIPPQSVYVVNGFNDLGFQHRTDIEVVVATYSLLQKRSTVAQYLLQSCSKDNNDNSNTENARHFKCVIADESHNLKQKNSQRSQIALPILQKAKRLLLLSGTPALARPVDLWLQLHALAPKLFGKYTAYTKDYCDACFKFGRWDVSGLSNAKELHSKLKQVMVRRLKCDVLHELPAKQRMVVPIKIQSSCHDTKAEYQANQQLMKNLSETRLSITDLVGDDQRTATFEARQLFMQAYQASGILKAHAVAEYLVDWIAGSGTQKVLVFAHFKAVLDVLELAISKHLKGVGHIRIDGSVASNERTKLVRKFQTSAQVRVALLSMTAAGVGLTLTAASNCMFAELHYTPGVLAQAEDRAHRIGQRNAVNIMYFVCKDPTISVDSQIWKMLGRKIGTLEQVIDGGSGKERVALAATEVEGKDAKPRQSAQEELSNFFAETAVDDSAKNQSKIPAKGSILSFFQKAASATNAQSTNRCASATENSTSEPMSKVASKIADGNVEWTCHRCTFINSKRRAKHLRCDMCQATFVEETPSMDQPLHVTPSSGERRSGNRVETPTPNLIINFISRQSSRKKSPKQVVNIDDEESYSTTSESNRGRKKAVPEIVVIDDDVEDRPSTQGVAHPEKRVVRPQQANDQAESLEMLTFSVSKNSGRIAVHYAAHGNLSSLVNFGIHDVVTEETANAMEEAQISRGASTGTPAPLAFNKDAVDRVISQLDQTKIPSETERERCRRDIRKFVIQYLSLREIERKVIQDSGVSFSSNRLAQSAAKVMTAGALVRNSNRRVDGNFTTTERYGGGAKEQAQLRLQEGTASSDDLGVLKGESCAWCAGALSEFSRQAKAIYCSQECAEEGRVRRGGMFAAASIRKQVFALEGGVCQLCGIDAHALYLRVKSLPPAQRLSVLCNAKWTLPKTHKALDRLLQEPTEGAFWQADHIVPVAEGGGDCGLENLRTLCVPCHVSETAKLRGRLKLTGGGIDQQENTDGNVKKRKQTDIRALFGGNEKRGKS